jgi:DNA-binding response OmpR family regulator
MDNEKTILLVEDEEDIALLLGKRLRSEGYAVTRVADAVQAMQQVMRLRPNLIILDLMIPGGGGLGVLHKVRRSILVQDTPVLVLTGTQDPEHKAKVMELGAEAYFQKPYDPIALLAEIKRHIR